tara:strand:- start:159 stop:371 length:213 start_codon:yes stop_codon:yes gene_type:complete
MIRWDSLYRSFIISGLFPSHLQPVSAMPHVSIHPPCLHERGLHEQVLIASMIDSLIASQIISSTSDTYHV